MFDKLINNYVFFFVSFVVQVLCDNQNEHSSAAVDVDDTEQDIFHRPAAAQEKLSVELPIHRGQAQGNGIVLSCWLKNHLISSILDWELCHSLFRC